MVPDLIVHIGAGKTGSSAIQQALRELNDKRELPIFLGLMFENLSDERCDVWRGSINSWPIFWGDVDVAGQLLFDILKSALDASRESRSTPLVWSNESIFERPEAALFAVSKLRSSGHSVRVQCYVRRQDAWAYSSYIQWGLKHKVYAGPVLPFGRWIKSGFWRGSDFTFYSRLLRWREVLKNDLEVFNYDAHPDIAGHFFRWNGLGEPGLMRVNDAPNSAVLTGYALLNQTYEEAVLPDTFEACLGRARNCPPEWMDPLDIKKFLPSLSDLESVRSSTEEDRRLLADLLVQTGDPPVCVDTPISLVVAENSGEVREMLTRLWLSAERELAEMKGLLSATQAEYGSTRAILVSTQSDLVSANEELSRFRRRPIRSSIREILRRIGLSS